MQGMGIFTAAGDENKSDELLTRIREAGAAMTDMLAFAAGAK